MEACKNEFLIARFGFGGVSPDDFSRFQWKWPGKPYSYLVYRIAIAAYQLLWNILVIAYWDDTRFYRPVDTTAKWPIYLSNWSFFFLTLYFVTAALSNIAYQWNKRKNRVANSVGDSRRLELIEIGANAPPSPSDKQNTTACLTPLPWYFKMTWVFQTIATSAVLFVAMGYWFFEYDPKLEKLQIFTIHVHAVSTILGLADFMVVANPSRFLHFIYPVAYFTSYIAFTVVYYYAGGINPYGGREMYEGMIDWEDGISRSVAMSAVFVLVLGPFLHSIYFGLSLLRRQMAGDISLSCRRCNKQADVQDSVKVEELKEETDDN